MSSKLRDTLRARRLILDGAMGTMIQAAGAAPADGNNDMLVLTHPEVIADIHRQYLEAGADIISTCTFNAQRISQSDYNTQHLVEQINYEAARLARAEADKYPNRFVAGSVGPTTRLLSIADTTDDPAERKISFDELQEAYLEQMRPLIRGGVDAILIETSLDILNAKAAVLAAMQAMKAEGQEVEIMLSITVTDANGRILSGHTVEEFSRAMSHAPLLSIGLNCSMGAAAMHNPLRRLKEANPGLFISVHPNAGLPNSLGQYDDTPEMMAGVLEDFMREGLVNIIGGCCGTTPAHIRAFKNAESREQCRMQNSEFRIQNAEGNSECRIQDSELGLPQHSDDNDNSAFCIPNSALKSSVFTNVGERCNVAGSRKFLRLISERNYAEAVEIARKQVRDGAMMIDINMDDGMLDAAAEMERFIRLLCAEPDIASVPIMIDSSNFAVIERGLKALPTKGVVNSISLKDGEKEFLRRAHIIYDLGASVVVMCFDEEGQATDYERRIRIAERAYNLLVNEIGFDPSGIIIDPNILTVATGMEEHLDYAHDFVEATRWIRQNLPGASVSGGLSNLSFAFRGNNPMREAMHAVFLWRAVQAGMNMAIMNPATAVTYDDIPTDLRDAIDKALFTERTPESVERLSALALTANAEDKKSKIKDKIVEDPHHRLRNAIIHGVETGMEQDIKELLGRGEAPLDIISGPLMQGMNEVGTRFGEGKMFLPQVVKTARAMKCAVEILRPYFKSTEDSNRDYAGKVLIATVKGDVHDIGKNIVGTILTCNNYDVHDLGVMVAPETIVEEAQRLHPDYICLSGLITPSLEYMCRTAKALADAGINVPLMIGGATTSAMHTAVKIAPLYNGVVLHMRDAAMNPIAAARLKSDKDAYIAEIQAEQARLRAEHERKIAAQSPDAESEALRHRAIVDWTGYKPQVPEHEGTTHYSLRSIRDNIDWRYFYHAWKLKEGIPEAAKLRHEADQLLDELAANPNIGAVIRCRFMPAIGADDSIIIGGEKIVTRRKQYDDARPDAECSALCDFVCPQGDMVGVFAATISEEYLALLEAEKHKDANSPRALMLQTLADRVVEAAAETLHRELSSAYGFEGIRPAVGYPCFPGQENIFVIDKLINLGEIGISLTETGAMYPQASVGGLLITHPKAHY